MLGQAGMRRVLDRIMTIGQEYHLEELYGLVDRNSTFGEVDRTPSGPGKTEPRWHETVRSALFVSRKKGQTKNPRHGYHVRLKPLSSDGEETRGKPEPGNLKYKLNERFNKMDQKLDVLNSDLLDVKSDIREIKNMLRKVVGGCTPVHPSR